MILTCTIIQISGQLKSLQIVASLTAERDGEIRKAALNTLATGYKILGMLQFELSTVKCSFVMFSTFMLFSPMSSGCVIFA